MHNYYADRLFTALERGEPGPGQLLVAAPGMLDDTFARSVILIIEHNEQMTFGVNLTKRSELAVYNVMPDWISAVAKPQALYIGGPVNQQSVVGVGRTRQGVRFDEHPQINRLANRLAHIDLRSDPEEVAQLVDGMRLFAGYCEWAPGQLDGEIERGDWYVAPALPGDVIMPARADLWGDVMRRQPMPLPLFSTYPAEVTEN
ncbi:YqgE/AlgH family protein [Corynebacterium yudongzhengii]|uniref:YqgE/AlgH family protein n=1 Tax=Corynebacterium yudongzhengii TaxID=2080740 RepID=A0A2U1T4L9_9CORY|nr:YqgE/AlgH family protein [Corynebacterium yudongzhengii]AWB82872.1 YqgE/AlgH family protein [Corynebacterium yudongzhengii]PWC00933.1 YqgE/AlgH family protein [Corynebacterium yudongzhengii]